MDAAKLKDILRTEYGINNENEFNAAVKAFAGLNIGLFTMPQGGRRSEHEQKREAGASA